MPKIDDGGPAFPLFYPAGVVSAVAEFDGGMSLRDWFAGQAMAAFIRRAVSPEDWGRVAPSSYEIADAMLAARATGAGE